MFGVYSQDMRNNEAKIDVIDVNLEPFVEVTLDEPDIPVVESILMEALGLFGKDDG